MKLIAKISLLAVLIISTAVNAYVLEPFSWASNNIEFYIGFNGSEDGTSAADYQSALNNAMTSWGNNSNFQYSPISAYKDPCLITESNIYNSVRFKDDECGTAFGATTLAVAVSGYDDSNNTYVTAIGFNSLHDWGIHDNNSSSPYDFKRVALHEVGHTLGLDHSGTTASIMYPSYQNNVTTLQTDDINGIRAIYGNAYVLLINSWASSDIEFYTGFNTNEDGTSAADYQSALNNTITSWNNNSNFQYSINSAYKDPCDTSNSDINSVRFKDDYCGVSFGATTLATAGSSHYTGTTNSARAYIVFNSLKSWGIHDNSSDSPIDFKRVALHEVGHTLGLGHSGTTASIMYYSYQNNVTTLQTDDINGIRAIYGLDNSADDYGDDTSAATAISFNTNISGNIRVDGDNDYFSISVPAGGGDLDIYSTSSIDTYGYLLDSSANIIAEHDDLTATDKNFKITRTLSAGTYYIRVKGYYFATTGDYTLRADFTAIPNTPSTPSASDGAYTDKVRISWSSVSGANSYIIYRCTSTSSSSCSQISTDSSSPYDDTSATIGTTYYYRLKACSNSGGNGCSDYSNYDTGYSAIVVPNIPTVSDGDYTDKVRISWSSVSGANSYIIYRCTSTSSSSCSQIGTDSSSPYNDTSSTAGIIYYYRLTACSGSSGSGNCSSYSSYNQGHRAITAAPSIAFSPAAITAVVGADIGNITVINTGGVADLYSIVPAITNNLSFNANTGTISGIPSATASATTYTVTATNSFGSSAATISIEVKSFSLDIDGNETLNATNDGLIIFKYLLNPDANNLHTTIANDAIEDRKTTAQLKAYLDNSGTILDVDGNQTLNATNDGLIIFKYLLNPDANNLHTTIANDAIESRKTTTNLKTYLDKFR